MFQDLAQKVFGFAPVIFKGRGIFQYNFGIVPYRKPITVVIGAPIPVKKNEDPSKDEIECLHAAYIDELVKLYDDYNAKYGDPRVNLIVA